MKIIIINLKNNNSNICSDQLRKQMNSFDLTKLISTQMTYENCFTQVKLIGEGGFSKVFEVINKVDQCHYAIKQVILETSKEENLELALHKVMREARYLSRLSHPKIIRYYSSWVQNKDSSSASSSKSNSKKENLLSPEKVTQIFGIKISQIRTNNFCDYNDDELLLSYKELDDIFIDNDSYKDSEKEIDTPIRPPQPKQLIQLKKVNCNLKKFHSEEKKSKLKFETLIFYLQTELCRQTLDSYINHRNEQLRILKKQNNQIYQEQLSTYNREAQIILEQILDGKFQIKYKFFFQAIQYIHNDCQLVHRDLKPANIFMNAIDDIKIGDFGLVKRLRHILKDDQFSRIVSAKALENEDQNGEKELSDQIGTAYYASPEIRDARCKAFDQKMDIYSLGVIMFQLFHPMSTYMELMQKLNEAKNGNLPSDLLSTFPLLSALIIKCLSKDPSNRPSLLQIKESLLEKMDSSLVNSNTNSNASTTDDIFREPYRSYLRIQFEDDLQKQDYFCTIDSQQVFIYRNEKSKKALHLYTIADCIIELINQQLFVSHIHLNNFVIDIPSDLRFPIVDLLQHSKKKKL